MTSPAHAGGAARPTLDPATELGSIRLAVADLESMRDFYERTIGLRALPNAEAGTVALGAADERPLVELLHAPGAPPRRPGTTGLFHLALLVPSRPHLARAIERVAESGWRLTGASDHLVSEAVYLRDPEGNGIEIYRDRPRAEWGRTDGEIEMATIPLDLDGLMNELPDGGEPAGMAPGTTLGHVHLNVADIPAAERFYAGVLGFDVVVRSYPGALFVSAGGYHHHIGLNTWSSRGGPAPPPDALGMRWFELRLPTLDELGRVAERLAGAGVAISRIEGADGVVAADPSQNRLLLTAAG